MTIGEKIRELRRKNDITQEKLADYLGITFQSVSKWETGGALPDITYIAPIASFFGVTSDELLGIDREASELEGCEVEYKRLSHEGKVRNKTALCREVLRRHPKNYKWMNNLANCLCSISMHSPGFSEDEQRAAGDEGITLCLRIMEDCTDDDIRASCRQSLVYIYKMRGEDGKALAEAEKAPSIYHSRELLSDAIGDDEEAMRRHDKTLLLYTELMTMALTKIGKDSDTHEDIARYEAAIKIWSIIIDDGNFLFYHHQLSYLHKMIALDYAFLHTHEKVDCRDKVIENLREAMKHARLADRYADDGEHRFTAKFVRRAVYDSAGTSKNFTDTVADALGECMRGYRQFEPFREDSEFKAILEE